MEVKNIHNNPEERGFFGKVLGYIVSGLRSLARPKKNTKWDYIVPLSLVGLQLLVLDYALMNTDIFYYEMVSGEKINFFSIGILLIESVFLILMTLSIIFLTRLQRVLPSLTFLITGFFVYVSIIMFNLEYLFDSLIGILLFILLLIPYLLLEYLIANISILIKFGNKADEGKVNISPIRTAIAWAFYGFGIDILEIYAVPLFSPGAGTRVVSDFIFEGFYEYIGIPPLVPFFFFIFALIGYSIEKYKQKTGGKTR